MVCISPWNFPLAIFLGQITAALVTGNAVIAKPAEQTPLIAAFAVQLLHQAGVPVGIIQLLPGAGEVVGKHLVRDPRIAGVIFTGSTETARLINQTLASRTGPIPVLIAETGGQNVMIVDSTALLEQVVGDVVKSAFGSAGQRCSALRVLFVQEDVAPRLIGLLQGAMAELQVGDPADFATDVGPVIDKDAKAMLEKHAAYMAQAGSLIYQVKLPEFASQGTYFAPSAFEIKQLSLLQKEVFGPFLHVVRYKAAQIDAVIQAVNLTGYGLTLGIHSRIDDFVEYICKRVKVGNTYVNRSMTGAVVGVQPFGGEGLSGTGPKAGGPHYLSRLCVERAIAINTTAAGGNASLMSLGES
jgi:RHH-type proline utilization regulon transcriptional repressor/proline dehydrogenase/delta 1-pyrroline-5-carboxylate dehydrogenase